MQSSAERSGCATDSRLAQSIMTEPYIPVSRPLMIAGLIEVAARNADIVARVAAFVEILDNDDNRAIIIKALLESVE